MPNRRQKAVATALARLLNNQKASANPAHDWERMLADCHKEWDEALAMIKAGHFRTRYEIAAYFNRSKPWAGEMVGLMVQQGYLTREEVRQFPRTGRARQIHNIAILKVPSTT